MKHVARLITATLGGLLAVLSVATVLAYDTASGHFTGGWSPPGELSVGFSTPSMFTLGFGTSSTPAGVHAVAPGYAVTTNVSAWVTTGNTSGNFTTAVSPLGFLAPIIEAAATAGTTPSQLPFIIISTVIILLVSLLVTWGFRYMNANGSLFAKGVLSLGIIGMFVATRWWDWWMLVIFIIFFATFGIMSRHQSWQN